MSHATVLVVTENKPTEQELECLMAPYQEYGSMNKRNQYVKFLDKTEELQKEFKEETRSVLRKISDGSVYSKSEAQFYREPTPEESAKGLHGMGFGGGISYDSRDWGDGRGYRAKVRYTPEGFEEVDVPLCDFYSSFEEFLKDWHGYDEENFKEDGTVGYYDNPNSKWDWWQIGGRWSGFFKAKNTNEALQGKKSWTNENETIEGVDIIQKKNIDIDSMVEKAKENTERNWNILLNYFPDLSVFPQKSWGDCVDEYRANNGDVFDREAVIKMHEGQENYDSDKLDAIKEELKLWGDPIDFYCKGDKDAFYKSMLHGQFGTYAVLKDEFWYQKGELGWFGTSHNEDCSWEETFYELFESIDEEHWLTIIDYHC